MSGPEDAEDITQVPDDELLRRIAAAVAEHRAVVSRAGRAIRELQRRDPSLTFRRLWAITGVARTTLQRWAKW